MQKCSLNVPPKLAACTVEWTILGGSAKIPLFTLFLVLWPTASDWCKMRLVHFSHPSMRIELRLQINGVRPPCLLDTTFGAQPFWGVLTLPQRGLSSHFHECNTIDSTNPSSTSRFCSYTFCKFHQLTKNLGSYIVVVVTSSYEKLFVCC